MDLMTFIARLREVTSMLQEILDLLNRISTALDAISSKLSGLSGGLTSSEAIQVREGLSQLAAKAEQLIQ